MSPNELTDAIKLFSGLGAMGVLAWVLLYLFRVELPRRDQQFAQTLKDNNALLMGTLKEQREDFRKELEEIRAQHQCDSQRMSEAIDRMTSALADHQDNDRRSRG